MDANLPRRWAVLGLSGLLASTTLGQSRTNIRLDGSLGGKANQVPKLIGSEYQIDASIGRLSRNKANLFHSFSKFDVGTDAAVRFSAPPGVKNILARVTGGPSVIDGIIRSKSPADLFLINPAGIAFAKNAKLELDGSFTATTADLVRLPDGTELQARSVGDSILKVAPQASFGFSGKGAPIQLDGCRLSVSPEQNIALVGGDIRLRNASIGTDESTSVLRAAEPRAASGTSTSDGVFISGQDMVITGSSGSISKRATDNRPGKDVTIDLTGNLTITDNGKIDVGTGKDQNAGNVSITIGGNLVIKNRGQIKTSNNKQQAIGLAGSVEIHAADVSLANGGSIDTSSRGGDMLSGIPADAGSITIFADRLSLQDPATKITANTKDGFGNAGLIALHVNELTMSNRASITAEGLTPGLAGSFTLNGKNRTRASSVSITSGTISLRAGSNATGAAGDIALHADNIRLSGDATVIKVSTLAIQPDNNANAGNIVIDGGNLSVSNHATISAITQNVGNGGSIKIRVDKLTVDSGGEITSESQSTGNAGVVDIQVASGMYLNDSMIKTSAPNGNGGQIIITDNGVLTLENGTIETNAGEHVKKVDLTAGNINIGRGLVVLDNSQILANSSGAAGDITIDTRGLIRTENSKINAVGSSRALNGTIAVNGPETDLAGQLVSLPDQLQSALAQLHECCQLKLTRSLSSFVQKGVGGVPLDLGGWTPVTSSGTSSNR